MDFQKRRFQIWCLSLAIRPSVSLSIIANANRMRLANLSSHSFLLSKAGLCRYMVGDTGSSQAGKFSIFDCFDGGTGTLVCGVKESAKLYTNNIRTVHVEQIRNKAIASAQADALSQGIESKVAVKQAQKVGAKAAKVANNYANHILGPIVSSGWDVFEVIYYQGSVTEGLLRGVGMLLGTYIVGFLGDGKFGKIGYLIGSTLGSWIGGKIGLMAHDAANCVHFLLHLVHVE